MWDRNNYRHAYLLLRQLKQGRISAPFDRLPKEGPLGNLESWLTAGLRFDAKRTAIDRTNVNTKSSTNVRKTEDAIAKLRPRMAALDRPSLFGYTRRSPSQTFDRPSLLDFEADSLPCSTSLSRDLERRILAARKRIQDQVRTQPAYRLTSHFWHCRFLKTRSLEVFRDIQVNYRSQTRLQAEAIIRNLEKWNRKLNLC